MADENHSTNKNAHLNRISSAPFELGRLLQEIGDIDPFHEPKVTVETSHKIRAAIQHASNANQTVLTGLEALGKCLFTASKNQDSPLDRDAFGDIGCLIEHLAVEAQFLQITEADLTYFLEQAEVIPAEAHHG